MLLRAIAISITCDASHSGQDIPTNNRSRDETSAMGDGAERPGLPNWEIGPARPPDDRMQIRLALRGGSDPRGASALKLVPVNNIDLDLVMINMTPSYQNLYDHDP